MTKKKRRKPRGKVQTSVYHGGKPGHWEIVSNELPDSKDEIEHKIALQFLSAVEQRDDSPVRFMGGLEQNQENHVDFSVYTQNGRRMLELMEVAPLEKGGFEGVSQIQKPYDLAKWVYENLKGKSDKYGPLAKQTILLIYTTDDRFSLGELGESILRHWSNTKSQNFESIFLFKSANEDGTVSVISPRDVDHSFNPENYRNQAVLNLDVSKAKYESAEDGSAAIRFFISREQLYELGMIRRRRNAPCTVGVVGSTKNVMEN